MLINAAISGERNVIKNDTEILKYNDLTIGMQLKWNVKTNVITVIIQATGTTSRSIKKYLSNILGKHKIKECQKQSYWALHTYFRK
jgi:hypothetical protein